MRPDEINKIVECIKEQTDHKGDIFININNNAIPIEFIKSKIDAILNIYPNGNEETEILCKLLYEWEKENADL